MFGFGAERKALWGVALSVSAAASLMTAAALPAIAEEVVITIERVAAVSKEDPISQADFYAHVTIDGEVFKTPRIRNADVVTPNWVIRKSTSKRSVDVSLAILDKDTFNRDDLIDINRVDGKRHLDFRVRTRPCEVLDFSDDVRCRRSITRAGRERKSAEITFRVDVRR